MRALFPAWTRQTLLCAILSLYLASCEETSVPAIQASASELGGDSDNRPGNPRKNRCFAHMLYRVDGDQFRFMSGGQQSIDPSGSGSSSPPSGWNPAIEPRAKCRAHLDGYDGDAVLLWNDQVVDAFTLNKVFLLGDQVRVLSYEDDDGTRVEFHLYAQPVCSAWPFGVLTREQVEGLES